MCPVLAMGQMIKWSFEATVLTSAQLSKRVFYSTPSNMQCASFADTYHLVDTSPRTRVEDRSFSVAGPCLWNFLPVALRDRDISLAQFKRLLKRLWFV